MKLPPGKYLIKRHIPTYRSSWREKPGGEVERPRIVSARWVETTIKSDEEITITKVK